MKIGTEQLHALQEKELRRARQPASSEGFGDLFTRQLETERSLAPAETEDLASSPLAKAISLGDLPDAPAATSASGSAEAALLMEGMFSTVEQYAGRLARGNTADLKSAYGLLQDLGGQIENFANRYPAAEKELPELSAMLNDLAVLTATETFKVNRGDYF